MKNLKFGTCLPAFGQCADRYVRSGYGPQYTLEEVFHRIKKVPDITAVELVGNWHINDENFSEITGLLKDLELDVCMVVPDLWTQGKWGSGTFTAKDEKTRRESIEEVKKSMDWAAGVGCRDIDVWLGQDGFDYPLQWDYIEAWEQIKEALTECCDYRKDVNVLIEYKLKEPRTHLFISTAAKTKLLIGEVDRPNLGILCDIGHAQAAGENVGEAVAICNDLLWSLHINDNYDTWDDDMMFGSVHTIEAFEAMYWLDRVGYEDYYTLDMNPYRENGIAMAQESVDWVKGFFSVIEDVGRDKITEIIREGDATKASKLIREIFCGKN